MESYQEFLNRIMCFEKRELSLGESDFSPSRSVLQKVDDLNRLCPFYGDTVVFDLPKEVKAKIGKLVIQLYLHVPECFSEMLSVDTFHMTLHDLSNSPRLSDIAIELYQHQDKLKKIMEELPRIDDTIRMRTNFIINMVNTSLVLALCPINETEYGKLISYYSVIDQVKTLPYPFTPHITLAYYNKFGFGKESARKLAEFVEKLNANSFEFTLDTKDLYYQKFYSMNSFQNILAIGGFK